MLVNIVTQKRIFDLDSLDTVAHLLIFLNFVLSNKNILSTETCRNSSMGHPYE